VELPKFKAEKLSEKKLQVLWLRFLTEIDEHSTHIPEELLRNSEISEALENVRVSAFTKAELDTYDRNWDRVRVELTFKDEYYTKGLKEGEADRTIAIVKNAITAGMNNELITTLTGLTDVQIDAVRKEIKNKK
jgi:MoaA/NifB/PqqE/SkfB family radical SAM enzyme